MRLPSAVQGSNNLESTKNGDEEASPGFSDFKAVRILRLCDVLVGRLKQSEPDRRIKGRQVIKHNLIAHPDQLLRAAPSNPSSSSYLAVRWLTVKYKVRCGQTGNPTRAAE